ncbi:MAG: M4 family metallopeptidase [Acidobacteria bacterium]|nr:M4 family metallopeptidase [Acidobacteriota bacterium]
MREKSLGRVILHLIVSMFALTGLAWAGETVDLRGMKIDVAESDSNNPSRLAESLGLGEGNDLQIIREVREKNGITHRRYQQTFQGIPVWGEQIVVATNESGGIVSLHGQMVQDLEKDLGMDGQQEAAFTKEQALAFAKDIHLGRASDSKWRFENETSQLVIFMSYGKARLAYAVSYFGDTESGTPTRPTYLIDARTKEVLHFFEGLTTANGTGPGGNQKTGIYYYGTQFPAFNVTANGSTCSMNNSQVKSVNLNHGTSGSTAFSYGCYENTFKQINGAYSPINDAHFFGSVIFNMYQDWYSTAPLTFQLQMRVHYSSNYENAFWNGTAMTFGDGASTFYPLVSLDVSAHEVSHGFTEQNSNLNYSGQSGGINEAFSDMAGEAAQYFMNGSNDFLVGAEIFKGNSALRIMYDPPQDGSSIGCANDYYSGMDVHHSSGVFNKAFYTLATTSGWNTHKAFDVFVRANQVYWTPSTNFQQGADAVMDAASDLGYNTNDVASAFAAVCITVSGGGGGGGGGGGITDLDNGDSSTFSASAQAWNHFRVTIPAGATNLTVTTSGSNGDADLYTRFGQQPTTSSYDCRSISSNSNESCSHATPAAGEWYLGVYAYSAFSNVTISVSWDEPGGGGGGSCGSGMNEYTGTLSGTGDSDIHPNGTYFSWSGGTLSSQLNGPSGTDFDLYLYKWSGSRWRQVAKSESATSTESINYSASSGYYYYKISSYSGSGSYTFCANN